MISPKLYKSSRLYDFFMKSLGYESSIDRFLRSLDFPLAGGSRILDAGCGTGLLGLHFMQRIAGATLHATDLERNFLAATLANANVRGIDPERITVGVADISSPKKMTLLNNSVLNLDDSSFDLICIGAVVGYASDTESSLQGLIDLLAPGGRLINIEMNESLTGRFVSNRYHYKNISLQRMQSIMQNAGCEVTAMKFKLKHLPAKFTRTAMVAHKPESNVPSETAPSQ